jgi:hypothetical protein
MALDDPRAAPPASLDAFWLRLHSLEEAHRVARRNHERARRQLEVCRGASPGELRSCWEEYCEAIAALDEVTSELELFRGGSIHAFADAGPYG